MTDVWAVIAGGGTAGHVHPALAIAGELVGRGRSVDEIHFIGSRRGLEARIVPDHGYQLTALPGRGIVRSLSLQNLKSVAELGSACVQALRTLRRLKPRVLVSVGGYASLPAMAAAAVLRIPIVVTEQNSIPGAANRVGSRFAKVCAVGFANTELPRAVHTGIPLLGPILQRDRATDADAARQRLGIEPGRSLIAAFGGSLGARRINQAVLDATKTLADRSDLAIRHIIGERDWPTFGDHPVDGDLQYQSIRYENNMADVLTAADLAVCRAGAISVAEIAHLGTPAILVPLPIAPNDHQTFNARALTDHGGGVLVPDDEVDGPRLVGLVGELLDDRDRLNAIETSARAQARPDAAAAIADLVEKHARER